MCTHVSFMCETCIWCVWSDSRYTYHIHVYTQKIHVYMYLITYQIQRYVLYIYIYIYILYIYIYIYLLYGICICDVIYVSDRWCDVIYISDRWCTQGHVSGMCSDIYIYTRIWYVLCSSTTWYAHLLCGICICYVVIALYIVYADMCLTCVIRYIYT